MALLAVDRDRIAGAARRVMARCDELARVSATSGGIERVYLSPEHARVNRLAAEWMREVGMATRQDAAGNQLGRIDAGVGPRTTRPRCCSARTSTPCPTRAASTGSSGC